MSALYHVWCDYPMFRNWDWKKHPLRMLIASNEFSKFAHCAATYKYNPTSMILDSGAFAAWTQKKEVDIQWYWQLAREWHEHYLQFADGVYPFKWQTESVCLDVIGSGEGSRDNALAGIEMSKSFPVFHAGDDWAILDLYTKHWKKVGLSFTTIRKAPLKQKMGWLTQCFKRAYPQCCFHLFGSIHRTILNAYPFHSADASTWLNAGRFGQFASMPIRKDRSETPDLTSELIHHTKFERHLEMKWHDELKQWPRVLEDARR